MENGPAHWARMLGLLARKQGRRGARGGLVDNVVISASANRSGLGGCQDSSSGQASQARHSVSTSPPWRHLHKLEHGARNSRRLEEFPGGSRFRLGSTPAPVQVTVIVFM